MTEKWEPDSKVCNGCNSVYKPPMLQHETDYCERCFEKTLEDEHYEEICEWNRYIKAR